MKHEPIVAGPPVPWISESIVLVISLDRAFLSGDIVSRFLNNLSACIPLDRKETVFRSYDLSKSSRAKLK